jgi:uncharacterized integral membrane protein
VDTEPTRVLPPGGDPTTALPAAPNTDPDGLDERQRRQLVRVGVLVVIGILLVAFIFRNTRQVKVSFVFFTTTSSLIWVIVSSLVLGFLAGWLLPPQIRRYRARRAASKRSA